MVVNGRPVKRLKSRVTAHLHDFLTFPPPSSSPGSPPAAPFLPRVRDFLSRHSLLLPPPSPLMTWHLLFRVGHPSDDASVCLDVFEEDVSSSPLSPYCDHCRVVGWSGHPVCRKRFHFIIKADCNSIVGPHQPSLSCSHLLPYPSDSTTCNHDTTHEDVQDWVYRQLEDTTHLLHGVVHANGYGHLLRVNGREGGSRFLSGCHIMAFWDRLCRLLAVRLAFPLLVFLVYSGIMS